MDRKIEKIIEKANYPYNKKDINKHNREFEYNSLSQKKPVFSEEGKVLVDLMEAKFLSGEINANELNELWQKYIKEGKIYEKTKED